MPPSPLPRPLLSCITALALVMVAGSASADIFTFTDSNGVVHFSNSRSDAPGSKLYMKTAPKRRTDTAVAPFMPSDTSPERFARFDEPIRQAATLYQIPAELVRAVIKVESDYDPRAVSIAGARGLMQMIPATAERMQVRDIFDPRENIFGGVRFLRVLANTFNGDLQLTIAGYNAGEGAVMRYGGIPPFEETRMYVAKVLYYYNRYRAMSDAFQASSTPPTENAP
ncbi:MAG: lytic transglycosylase domain-containing protein [Deltaproteobacteria bacterium]|nr:lytic transglycosylase domain-containing protein [Deltaproteobacteria bacterium]